MTMNIINDVAQFNPAAKLLEETFKLIVIKMMKKKCADYNIIFLILEFAAENIYRFKLNMRRIGKIFFCKCNDIWVGIKADKL